MSRVNDPGVLAEVQRVHEQYEAALVGNDVAVLDRLFWRSPEAVRFGVGESQYGFDAIAAFRKARTAVDLARTVSNVTAVSFGPDTAITTVEFKRTTAGAARHGRQTQVWRRFEDGWKIVSAHVSFVWRPGTADGAAELVGLPIPPELRAGVEINVKRAHAIAQPLLEFELPDTVAMAPVFHP